jgi:hypothetical protein
MNELVLVEIAVIVLCLAGGGLLKGATGAGAPILRCRRSRPSSTCVSPSS